MAQGLMYTDHMLYLKLLVKNIYWEHSKIIPWPRTYKSWSFNNLYQLIFKVCQQIFLVQLDSWTNFKLKT